VQAHKNKQKSKHEFAFYLEGLTSKTCHLTPGAPFSISDEHVLARMRVVRMEPGQTCMLFDRESHLLFQISLYKGKKYVEGLVVEQQKNNVLTPAITFCLPVLKRDYFEWALYALVELGATRVQPIITEKVHRPWGGQKDYTRALHVMIAAAEQSKHFTFPELANPITLEQVCQNAKKSNAEKLFFDPSGQSASVIFDTLKKSQPQELIFMVGPEGDLSETEKQLVRTHGFEFCALTPTVLRAFQAVVVSLGLARSLLR